MATWKTDHDEDVFVIAGTNAFIRFINFKFGPGYAKYIDADDKDSQEALIDEDRLAHTAHTFAHMHSTERFNLQTSEGRKSALCHTLALLRWHDARKDKSLPDSDVSNDSMSAGEDHTSDESMGVEHDHTYNEFPDPEDERASIESINMEDEDDDASDD